MVWWSERGFRASPYDVKPIPRSGDGNRLLVGREDQIAEINDCILSGVLHATVEGENGVGKTSLVSVAEYRLWQDFKENDGPPFVPIKPLDFRSNDTAASFTRVVMFHVAGAFIEHRRLLRRHGYTFPGADKIEQWLSNPINRTRAIGVTTPAGGGSITAGGSANSSQGFTDHGFPAAVLAWLEECFPDGNGGIICTIDNLELLRTAKASIAALESMRDSLFIFPGLRWILCGANQVTRTLVQTPRLRGRLNDPVEVRPVGADQVREIARRRIEVYSRTLAASAPVGVEDFYYLYAAIGGHLRDAFKYAECFSSWVSREYPNANGAKCSDMLQSWLTEKAKIHQSSQAVQIRVRARGWQLFDKLADVGGYCVYGQYKEFDFGQPESMRQQMLRLVEGGLVRQDIEMATNGRNVMSLTPIGWLVARSRGVVTQFN